MPKPVSQTIPPIPNLSLRPSHGPADLPTLVALTNASNAADAVGSVDTEESLSHEYAGALAGDGSQELVLAEVAGAPVAYAFGAWRDNAEGERLYYHRGYVLPAWRRRGLGRALLAAMQARLRARAARHAFAGPRQLGAYIREHQRGAQALLANDGYTIARRFYDMLRPTLAELPALALPAGITLAPARPSDARAVFLANDEAFRDHWDNAPADEAGYADWLDSPYCEPAHWLVAWDGDQIAGVAINRVPSVENATLNRARGWVDDLSVRRPWRGRGLGRALLVASLHLFRDLGLTAAELSVDGANASGALRLYQSVGFAVEQSAAAYRKPLD